MFRARRAIVLTLAVLAALAAILFAPLLTYREVQSLNGEFIAIAKASLFHSSIPVMPGQSGDKPGRITIVRKDGWPCGSAAVDMLSMIGEVRWRLEAKPRAASIVGTASWNLDACAVEAGDR